MFRNPRENIGRAHQDYVPPSVGRPPSPPASPGKLKSPPTQTSPQAPPDATKMTSLGPTALPMIGRGSTTPRKSAANSKGKGKPNGNILAFFRKSEAEEQALFVQSRGATVGSGTEDGSFEDHHWNEGKENWENQRLDNDGHPVKRRKISAAEDPEATLAGQSASHSAGTDHLDRVKASDRPVTTNSCAQGPRRSARGGGLFVEDSDSELEDHEQSTNSAQPVSAVELEAEQSEHLRTKREATIASARTDTRPPPLLHDETSIDVGNDFADFDNMGDFEEDIYEEGDEFMARRWMEEQARLEEEMVDAHDGPAPAQALATEDADYSESPEAPSCPICSTLLAGISDRDAAVHVNNCLDGNPTPLPDKTPEASKLSASTENVKQADRFRKQPRAAKPGQANPFTLGESGGKSGSAFSKLMSGHAEDAAWADAAASEKASFGKPAYQRMCPFYKILPGFNICVDAFRYGAVEGCRAYFLSHFHSDHYVGLTAQWCHGPIYCSKVTANLVKQQLRVDPQFVVALDWETKIEVPGSNGVSVTMISANHCPGSSLYLFERVVGRGPNPKTQRVLHCGDFRACRAHVQHPLLRPDVLDAVSGKKRDQKIDVCYLDTTYLNPRYAFPSQEAVIKACADMCVSLSKVRADETDGWETMKRERAGAGMAKFVRQGSDATSVKDESIKQEEVETDGIPEDKPDKELLDAMTIMKRKNEKYRGRLLVVVGTYSIGKERICMGIARALNSKIYAPAGKLRICRALEDPELSARLTTDPTKAQVHMTPLFEIRAETLDDYLKDYKDHFSRAVGFRPSGWNYRPPNSRFTDSPSVSTVLHSDNWKSGYSMKELVPQRGSTSRASCFGVPYSEHSSFRELTMFCCSLKIDKIIPTVNVGNAKSRERMKGWCEKWAMERKKNGLFQLKDNEEW